MNINRFNTFVASLPVGVSGISRLTRLIGLLSPTRLVSLGRLVSLVSLASLLTLTGCQNTESTQTPAQVTLANEMLVGTEWRLKMLVSDEGDVSLPDAKPMLMFHSKEQVAGFDGCNRFRGPVKLKENILIFGMLASTKRFCHDVANTDMAFMGMLVKVRFAKATATSLTLLDKSQQPLATFIPETKTPVR